MLLCQAISQPTLAFLNVGNSAFDIALWSSFSPSGLFDVNLLHVNRYVFILDRCSSAVMRGRNNLMNVFTCSINHGNSLFFICENKCTISFLMFGNLVNIRYSTYNLPDFQTTSHRSTYLGLFKNHGKAFDIAGWLIWIPRGLFVLILLGVNT